MTACCHHTKSCGPWIAGWLLVAAILCAPWDRPIAAFCLEESVPGDISALFGRAEWFGHGYGALGIAITILILDPTRRRQLPRFALSFAAAGLLADLTKLQVWRVRPRFLGAVDQRSTFVGTLWTNWDGSWSVFRDDTIQSFPSAHTAGAVAIAYVLSQMYPAGKYWFFTLATLCALNRVEGGAHFLSDVLVGAALGYIVAYGINRNACRRNTLRLVADSDSPQARAA